MGRSSRASRSASRTTKWLARSRFGRTDPVSSWGRHSYVRAFDATGKPIWKQANPGEAYGVDFSADGQLLVVAYGDGTIRWLRGSDGAELLALFVDVPTRRWVAWTPTGYYMASPGGEDLIGWHLNRGWTQVADFFPASRFSARFNRPDIVQLVLKTHDEAAAVSQANEKAKRRQETASVAAALPPVVDDRLADGRRQSSRAIPSM